MQRRYYGSTSNATKERVHCDLHSPGKAKKTVRIKNNSGNNLIWRIALLVLPLFLAATGGGLFHFLHSTEHNLSVNYTDLPSTPSKNNSSVDLQSIPSSNTSLVIPPKICNVARDAPKLVIVGAMKSGSTALYELLGRHPQLLKPAILRPGAGNEGEFIRWRVMEFL